MCEQYSIQLKPITVDTLVGFMLFYVHVLGNSSANLSSVMSSLHSVAKAFDIKWPDFSSHGTGANITARILKVQKDWPAEIRGAPALTLRLGLTAAIRYLLTFGQNLWALQWIFILSTMHALLLRPSEIIPLDKMPVSLLSPSHFRYPVLGDFTIVPASSETGGFGGVHYRIGLYKTRLHSADYRACTVSALDLGPTAVVNAPAALRKLLLATGISIFRDPPETPILAYRRRDGSLSPARFSRAHLMRELREHILKPAGVTGWQSFTLRSLRPGGTTDMAAAGIPAEIVRQVGKWSSIQGSTPYNRIDHHILQSLAVHSAALGKLQ